MNITISRQVAAKLLQIEAIKLNLENPYTWASGWNSPIYCDNRLALSYPEIRTFIKNELTLLIKNNFIGTDGFGTSVMAGGGAQDGIRFSSSKESLS